MIGEIDKAQQSDWLVCQKERTSKLPYEFFVLKNSGKFVFICRIHILFVDFIYVINTLVGYVGDVV